MTSRVSGGSFEAHPAGAARAATRPRPRRRYTTLQRAVFVLGLVCFALASTYSSLVLLARVTPALFPGKSLTSIPGLSSAGAIGIGDGGEGSVFNKRINLLILGLDKRPGDVFEGAYRTDVVMITTVDPVTGKASGLSIPRDVVFGIYDEDCERFGEDRINTAYGRGWSDGDSFGAAAEEVKHTLFCELGIEIDHYVIMDFDGVETLVEAIGGVDVDIPEDLAVYDWYYSDEGGRPARYVTYPPGSQHFDGYNAVAFGRYRGGSDGDFGRVKRQQLVLQAALSKALQLGWADSPGQIRDAWDSYNATVRTDITISEAAGYGLLLKDTGGIITMYSVADENPLTHDPGLYDYTGPGGAALQRYDTNTMKYWLDQVFTKTEYANSDVAVRNGRGAGESGTKWASAVARYLRGSGLPEVYLGGDSPVQAETQIILHAADRRIMAEDIAEWLKLPPSSIIEEPRDSTDLNAPDIVVIVGTGFELPD